jgi:ABC-type transport system involved in multi-copper enzyme maturation permease subunit
MRQALTILEDSLRMLMARRLFWMAFLFSGLMALTYASISFTPKGVSILFGLYDFENDVVKAGTREAKVFYVLVFNMIVQLWLAWGTPILALLSTASIFPEFLAEGSVGVSLAKPLSRLRLFFWKYVGGLLFTASLTLFFTLIAFVATGLRLGEWNFTFFWAVPIVTFSFSLLYSVSVFVGVWRRSALFALITTGTFWASIFIVSLTENVLYLSLHTDLQDRVEQQQHSQFQRPRRRSIAVEERDQTSPFFKKAYEQIRFCYAVLPKTSACSNYLKQLIVLKDQAAGDLSGISLMEVLQDGVAENPDRQVARKFEQRDSAWFVFGTSAAFELVLFAGAAGIFIRRDF